MRIAIVVGSFPEISETFILNHIVGMMELGEEVDVFSIVRSIDKLDKLRRDAVVAELAAKGLDEAVAQQALGRIEAAEPSAELQAILRAVHGLGVPSEAVEFSPMLARGLDYYTGSIFEVYLPGFASGSLAGGGRYDDLIEQLGGPKMPAVGIAFGFDRMVEAAAHLGLTPSGTGAAEVLVTLFDATTTDDPSVTDDASIEPSPAAAEESPAESDESDDATPDES